MNFSTPLDLAHAKCRLFPVSCSSVLKNFSQTVACYARLRFITLRNSFHSHQLSKPTRFLRQIIKIVLFLSFLTVFSPFFNIFVVNFGCFGQVGIVEFELPLSFVFKPFRCFHLIFFNSPVPRRNTF